MERKKKIVYLERLRAISTFLVMLIHAAAAFWDRVPLAGGAFLFLSFIMSLVRPAVPCFLMITGALLLGKESSGDIGFVLKKRTLRIFIILVVWTFGYAILRTGTQFLQGSRGRALFAYFSDALKQPMHFWYLYTLLGIYLVLPFLRLIAAEEERRRYFLILAGVTGVLLPFVFNFLPVRKVIPFRIAEYLNFGLGYTGYVVLGYGLSVREVAKKQSLILYALGVCGLFAAFAGTVLYCRKTGRADQFWFDYLSPFIALYAAAVFLLFKRCFNAAPASSRRERLLTLLGENSFCMYLVHVLFNEAFIMAGLNAAEGAAWRALPVSLCVWVCSLTASVLLRKIPFVRKYLC